MRGTTKRCFRNWIDFLNCLFTKCLVKCWASVCVETSSDYSSFSALAVLAFLCLPETGQLLFLLLAAILSKQQLWLEGGRSRPAVCVVWCRRDCWWVAVFYSLYTVCDIGLHTTDCHFDSEFLGAKKRKPVHFNTYLREWLRAVELANQFKDRESPTQHRFK